MAKPKTKGTTKTVSDTPVPQPITIRSTNPKIMADNILKLEESIKAADVSANPTGEAEETLLTSIGIDGKKYELGPTAENTSYDNTTSGLVATNTQAALDELRSNVVNVDARLVSVNVTYDAATNLFKLPSNVTIYPQSQFSCVTRNTNTGDLYMLTFYGQSNAFAVTNIIGGNAPSDGNVCVVQYIGIYA